MEENLNDTSLFSLLDFDCERGNYNKNGGKENSDAINKVRMRTVKAIPVLKGDKIICTNYARFGVCFADSEFTAYNDTGSLGPNAEWIAPSDGFAKVTFLKADYSEITSEQEYNLRTALYGFLRCVPRVGFDNIEHIRSMVDKSNDGYQYFDSSIFSVGGLSNGVINTSINTRLYTTNILSYDTDITIRCDDGWRYGIHYYNSSDEFISGIGWLTGSITIRSGSRFRINLAKNPDYAISIVSLENAVLKHLQYSSNVYNVAISAENKATKNNDEVYAIKNGKENLLHYSTWVNGSLTNGNFVTANFRACSTEIMSIGRDVTFIVEPNFKIGIAIFSNGVYKSDTGWITTGEYTLKANTEFKMTIGRITEDSYEVINVKEFVFKVTFSTAIINDDIEILNNYPIILNSDDFVNGSLIPTNGLVNEGVTDCITTGYIKVTPLEEIKLTYPVEYGSENETISPLVRIIGYKNQSTDNIIAIQSAYTHITHFIVPNGYEYIRISISFDHKSPSLYKDGDFKILYEVSPVLAFAKHLQNIGYSTTEKYTYKGELINFKRHGFKISKLFAVPQTTDQVRQWQGFTVYNGIIIQLYGNDRLILADFVNGSILAEYTLESGHGNTIDLSDEFYDVNDEFPLAYITTQSNPATVNVFRITRTEATLIRKYSFSDITKTGYYYSHSLDKNNNIIYTIGYTNDSYYLDDNNNKMIVSAWDLSNTTSNGDGTLSPNYIKSFYLPFMITTQGLCFYDNKIFVLSSHNGAGSIPTDTKIYVVNPYDEAIVSIFDDFPSYISTHESEGLAVIDNGEGNDLIINTNYYYTMKFYD